MKLFCIPGGGTPSAAFYSWAGAVTKKENIVPLEYPGRGMRRMEAPSNNAEVIARDMAQRIIGLLEEEEEYILVSSCIGTIVEYEVYRQLRECGVKEPLHFFVFSANAPHSRGYREKSYVSEANRNVLMSTCRSFFKDEIFENADRFCSEYVDCMIRLSDNNGNVHLPSEEDFVSFCDNFSFEQKMSLDFAGQTIRMLSQDWEMAQKYTESKREKLYIDCPVTVIYGKNDPIITREQAVEWEKTVSGHFRSLEVEGEHNLITEQKELCLKIIEETF